ncbi:hypothetical protein QCA50_017956 [Cerrena zonata]|uniref:Uncharacterized protein n=1 Tax=Cerrena zonata TaxID=2478898 RepID=A0AAW0FFJ5_9APHY
MPHLVAHNVVPLTQHNVFDILDHLSGLLYQAFGGRVTLVVHGGIVMVLHQRLACRESTRDIDFCLRSFVSESQKLGIHDAEARLNSCINATAKRFQLGADWMNCHADVALPMSIE